MMCARFVLPISNSCANTVSVCSKRRDRMKNCWRPWLNRSGDGFHRDLKMGDILVGSPKPMVPPSRGSG